VSDPKPRDPDLQKALESLERTMRDAPRKALEPEPDKKPPRAVVIQLPFWPEPVRGAPNTLLRSAFFAAIHSKSRKKLGILPASPEEEPVGITIAAQNGDTIKYAGTQLNQYDGDVFFESLHRARRHPVGTECFFRGYDFLKAIGRLDGKREYQDLDQSFRRLRNGAVDIEWQVNGHHYVFSGSLISSYTREKKTKLYKITFAKEICALFAPASWTQLEWKERMTLKGRPLAQWLHSYFSSHAKPFPVSVAFLHTKTGSTRPLLKRFKEDLKRALAVLEEKLGWIATWNGDLLTIERPPSGSQSRHLIRHAKAAKAANKRLRSTQQNPLPLPLLPLRDLLPAIPVSTKKPPP
jgi:hypothetical protein